MRIIKEFITSTGMVSIRSNTYTDTLSYIKKLVEEARKDFPDVEDSEIGIVKYGGDYFAGVMGIEFIPNGQHDIPDDYGERAYPEILR